VDGGGRVKFLTLFGELVGWALVIAMMPVVAVSLLFLGGLYAKWALRVLGVI